MIVGRPMPVDGTLDLDAHRGCCHHEDAATSRAAIGAAMAGPHAGGPYRSRGRVPLPDGSIRPRRSGGIGRCDDEGRLVATTGPLLDVTDAVEAARRARDN